jgi:tRNA A37 threonylcarbamoyladenosine synthetase subunit TsaC/SUA5/YrdC
VSHPQRKTLGLRVPNHSALLCLLELHQAPLLSSTLIMPNETEPLNEATEIRQRLQHELAAVIDCGTCAAALTTVINLEPLGRDEPAVLIRQGLGSVESLGLNG